MNQTCTRMLKSVPRVITLNLFKVNMYIRPDGIIVKKKVQGMPGCTGSFRL